MRGGHAKFFQHHRTAAEIGRTFSEDEDKVGAPPVVVISDRLWQTRVQSRPSNARPVNHASRSELHRHRRDAAASDFAAGHGCLAVDDAAQQQRGVDAAVRSTR